MTDTEVIYISGDVEFDGPLVGRNSMTSFALTVAGRHRAGGEFERPLPDDPYYRTLLRPIGFDYDPETFAVSGLNRRDLMSAGTEPVEAMTSASRFVAEAAGDAKPVLVLHPVAVDWAWLHYYWTRFDPNGCPFGYNAAVDLRSIYMGMSGVDYVGSAPKRMPESFRTDLPHTHDALDDARHQGAIFASIMEHAAQRAEVRS